MKYNGMNMFFFFQAEDGIRDIGVTGVQTCALPISARPQYALLDRQIRLRRSRAGRVGQGGPVHGGGVPAVRPLRGVPLAGGGRESGLEGKRVELGGRRYILKKKHSFTVDTDRMWTL